MRRFHRHRTFAMGLSRGVVVAMSVHNLLMRLVVVLLLPSIISLHDRTFVVDHPVCGGGVPSLRHFLVVLGLLLPLIQLVVNIFLPLLRRPVAVVAGPVAMATWAALHRSLGHFLRAQVRVVTLHVAGEAGHVHVVELAHGVRVADLVQALLADLGLLAVGRLVAFLAATMADDLNAGWAPAHKLSWLVEVGDLALIDPILFVAEVSNDGQLQVMRRYHVLNMDKSALRTQGAKAQHVVGAYARPIYDIAVTLVKRVVKIAHFTTKFAEAALEERTHLLFLVTRSTRDIACADDHRVELFGLRVLVKAVLAFLTLTMLLVKAANRHSGLVKVVHELTLVAFLATVAHPMNTDGLLTLLLIYRLVNGPQVRINIIDGHEPIRLLLHRHMSPAICL